MDDHTYGITPYQRHRALIIANPYETRHFDRKLPGNTRKTPFYFSARKDPNPKETTIGPARTGQNTQEQSQSGTIRE